MMSTHLDRQIQTAFDFTADDLQKNRAGRLTSRQQQQLEANMMAFWKVAGLTLLLVLMGTVAGALTVLTSADPVLNVEYVPAAFLIIVVIAVIFLVWFYRHRQNVYAEIRAGRVIPLEGRLKVIKSANGMIGRFQVKKHTFNDLTQEQYDVLRQIDDAYKNPRVIVYHVPHHYHVLSLTLTPETTDAD